MRKPLEVEAKLGTRIFISNHTFLVHFGDITGEVSSGEPEVVFSQGVADPKY